MCIRSVVRTARESATHRRLTQSVADPVPVANLTHLKLQSFQNILLLVTFAFLFQCFKCQKFGHRKTLAGEERPAPSVVRLAIPATTARVSSNARTAVAATLPSAKTARNGYLKNGSAGLSLRRVRAGRLREAEPQLRWWPPGAAPHSPPLVRFIHKLISRGLRDRKNPLSSLPLQAHQGKKQPRPPQINSTFLHLWL